MQTLIHADIFFFITTIVVIALGAVSLIILIYIAIILHDVRKLSRLVQREGEEIAQDVDMLRQEMRHDVRAGASAAAAVFNMIRGLFQHRARRRAQHTKRNEKPPHTSV